MAPENTVYRLTPLEIARGYIVGSEGMLPAAKDPTSTPRGALESVMLAALQRQPCGIAFSGGRDSSLVLAVAVDVARREGLPVPVPITRRFAAAGATEESDWQELVVRHVGVSEWVRLEFKDELEVIGPYAQRHLREHGVVWPAAIASATPLLEQVQGGTLLDGEGGDDVLGFENHRIGLASFLMRYPRAANRRALPAALRELTPRAVRYRLHWKDRETQPFVWLRPEVRKQFIDDLARERTDRPLSFPSSVRAFWSRRALRIGELDRAIVARRYDVDRVSPLLEPDLVHAIARDGGVLGRGDRTAVIHSVAGDLLPSALVWRRTKAVFNRAYIGELCRSFAASWDGSGVDHDLVDADALRRAWLDDVPHYMTALLLQQAWLAETGSAGLEPEL